MLFVLIVSIAIPVQSVFGEVLRIDNLRVKFVVSFSMKDVSKDSITNYINNQLFPPMRDKLITKLDNNFIDYTISYDLRVLDHGNDRYEVYPKIWFSGNTTLNRTQMNNGINSTIDDWLTVFETSLATKNGFDVKYYIHKSFGTIRVNGAL